MSARTCRSAAARPAWATLVLVVTATVGVAGCRPVPCSQPYPAALWEQYQTGPNWPPGSTDRMRPHRLFDSDGDGVEDSVDGAPGRAPSMTVHRASGDLVFAAGFGVVVPFEQPAPDLDGDGADDVALGGGGNITAVISGPDLLATPPGQTYEGPVQKISGKLLRVVPLATRLSALVLLRRSPNCCTKVAPGGREAG